jgi:hypothetical protein
MKYGTKPLLNRLDRLPEHRLELFRRHPPRVAEVDLVVLAVEGIAVLGHPFVVQAGQGWRFIIIRSDM